MTEPTDAELGKLAEECGIGWGAGLGGMSDFLSAFARAALARWGTPQQEAQEPVATLHCNDVGYVWARATEVGKLMRFEQPLNLYTATQPAPAPLSDDVVRDAARYRLLRRGRHWSVIDGIGNDLLRAEALDAAVDAARKQGASHDR